jgi:hypothetical protein
MDVKPWQPLSYDEWLTAGMPDERRVRSVLAVFRGRLELLEPPTVN